MGIQDYRIKGEFTRSLQCAILLRDEREENGRFVYASKAISLMADIIKIVTY